MRFPQEFGLNIHKRKYRGGLETHRHRRLATPTYLSRQRTEQKAKKGQTLPVLHFLLSRQFTEDSSQDPI